MGVGTSALGVAGGDRAWAWARRRWVRLAGHSTGVGASALGEAGGTQHGRVGGKRVGRWGEWGDGEMGRVGRVGTGGRGQSTACGRVDEGGAGGDRAWAWARRLWVRLLVRLARQSTYKGAGIL